MPCQKGTSLLPLGYVCSLQELSSALCSTPSATLFIVVLPINSTRAASPRLTHHEELPQQQDAKSQKTCACIENPNRRDPSPLCCPCKKRLAGASLK
jgi:hypothetical protein